jgi:hypothetical protein
VLLSSAARHTVPTHGNVVETGRQKTVKEKRYMDRTKNKNGKTKI